MSVPTIAKSLHNTHIVSVMLPSTPRVIRTGSNRRPT